MPLVVSVLIALAQVGSAPHSGQVSAGAESAHALPAWQRGIGHIENAQGSSPNGQGWDASARPGAEKAKPDNRALGLIGVALALLALGIQVAWGRGLGALFRSSAVRHSRRHWRKNQRQRRLAGAALIVLAMGTGLAAAVLV